MIVPNSHWKKKSFGMFFAIFVVFFFAEKNTGLSVLFKSCRHTVTSVSVVVVLAFPGVLSHKYNEMNDTHFLNAK